MIKIDERKCTGCNNCIDKCLLRSLRETDGKVYFDAARGCIKCMHCASACPENAITFNGEAASLNKPVFHSSEGFAEDVEGLLTSRRSYRNFSEKKVPVEEIEHALDIASWAPSAKNQHPTKYYLIDGRETIDKLTDIIVSYLKETGKSPEILDGLERGVNMIFANAQIVILAYARNNALYPREDTALALNYAELALQSKNIGTCWSGYFTDFANEIEEIREMFPVPENNSFYGSLLAGYPTEEYYYVPERLRRADIRIAGSEPVRRCKGE